jgi:hypothetical protein
MCYFRKRNTIKNLNYWNVDLQEAYFSPIEVNERFKKLKKIILFPSIMSPNPLIWIS